jgi:hypothetical protein
MFCVGSDRTLALLIHPDRPRPSKAFVEITEQRLQELLPAEQGQAWNIAVSNALPELSDTFVPAIEEAARGCKVLYIVAQPQLSRIPFAALSFRDGSPLVSRCARSIGSVCDIAEIATLTPESIGRTNVPRDRSWQRSALPI